MGKRTVKLTKQTIYAADFETTDDLQDGSVNDQRVWLAGFMNIGTYEKEVFNNQTDFMAKMFKLHPNQTTHFYFHNLKFDGSFIIPWLETHGYTFVSQVKGPMQYSVLIDKMNNWFSINIQRTKQGKVTIADSVKLFPTSLQYLPDEYGTPTKKIKEDSSFYNEWRSPQHEPTEEESKYFHNDLQVLAETLNAHFDWYNGQFKTTQASQAWASFVSHFPAWQLRFPPLTDREDFDMRLAYIGGISYVPKKYAGITFYAVDVLDVNSMYPHKAAYSKLPYGNATYVEDGKHPPMSKFWIAKVILKLTLKEGKMPCISSKQIDKAEMLDVEPTEDLDNWIINTKGVVTAVISCIDYETMHESYDVVIKMWKWHYEYSWKVQKEVQSYVLTNNKIKEESSEKAKKAKARGDIEKYNYYMAKRQRAKIDNNAFYGKFGEAIEKVNKLPFYTEEKGVTYSGRETTTATPYRRKYLPVAIAITAWARQQLVRLGNTLGEDFLYCDTDSVHFKRSGVSKIVKAYNNYEIDLHDEKLGSWSKEGSFKRGKYLRPKCYIEETLDGENEVTLAGLPADKNTGARSKTRSFITFENLDFGTEVPQERSNKLMSVRTRTGTKLVPTTFKIKDNADTPDENINREQPEWKEWEEHNFSFDWMKEAIANRAL